MATMQDIKGKLVVLTGNNEVGYGAENGVILGVARSCEYAEDTATYPLGFEGIKDSPTLNVAAATATALGETGKSLVASVEKSVFVENVAISETDSKQPSAGDYVLADGSGGVVKVASDFTGFSTAIAISVDTTANTATIMIL